MKAISRRAREEIADKLSIEVIDRSGEETIFLLNGAGEFIELTYNEIQKIYHYAARIRRQGIVR